MQAGNTRICELLLDAGADLEATDEDHSTPLFEAIHSKCLETTRLLLERGQFEHYSAHDSRRQRQREAQ